jgi:hypothetical protein
MNWNPLVLNKELVVVALPGVVAVDVGVMVDVSVSVLVIVVVDGCMMEGGSAMMTTPRPTASIAATKDRPAIVLAIAKLLRR